MIIRVRRSPREFIEGSPHESLSRRDFLRSGLLTGAMSITVPLALKAAWMREAWGAGISCPAPTLAAGALVGLMRIGGPAIGNMFLGSEQLACIQATGSTAAKNYGINPANLVQPGSNWWVPAASAFATGLGLNGNPPPGYTVAQWAAVLRRTSVASQIGSFPFDDAAGQNLGFNAAASPYKGSRAGSDLQVNTQLAHATWALGAPSTSVSLDASSLTPAALVNAYSLLPARNAVNAFSNASAASASLVQSFSGILFNNESSPAFSKAVCGFQGAKAFANPAFAASLFGLTALPSTATIQPGKLTAVEQAWLLAFYQSAVGGVGGVFLDQNGQDYHGQSLQKVVVPGDYDAGRMVAMFLAACDASGKPGAMVIVSNGQVISNSFATTESGAPLTITNGAGQVINVESPVPLGDAGGSYNAGFVICCHPSSAPQLKACGTLLNSSNGNFQAPVVSRVDLGMASLYLTALTYLSGLESGYDLSGITTAMRNALGGLAVPVLI